MPQVDPYEYMSDAQVYNRIGKSFPNSNEFSVDAFLEADPRLRGVFADAYYEAEGDPIGTYAVLGDNRYQDALMQRMLGERGYEDYEEHPEWFEGRRQGANDMVEDLFAQSAPSIRRNTGVVDWLSERYGGMPYPGGEYPAHEGPAFGGSTGAGYGGGGYRSPVGEAQNQAYRSALRSRGRSPSSRGRSRGGNSYSTIRRRGGSSSRRRDNDDDDDRPWYRKLPAVLSW